MTAQRNTRRVRLEDLFRWNRELDIKDERGDTVTKVYQRVLNDVDMEKARLSALRYSRNVRLSLRDLESGEYAALMENVASLDQDQKLSILMMNVLPDIYEKARQEVRLKMPKQPNKEANLEDVENYEAEVDEYDDKVVRAIAEKASELTNKEKEKLLALDEEAFNSKLLIAMENQICQNMMSTRFDEEMAWRGTYEDPKFKVRYFGSYEKFQDVAHQIKEQLINGYRELTINKGDLKN